MPYVIEMVSALEVLDSRSRPTLEVTIGLRGGISAGAGVPSGASTGSREAVERRDGDPSRYAGQGVSSAVQAVDEEIADRLVGHSFDALCDLDAALIDLDGTSSKERLGANAVVGVSMAAARAMATAAGQPLYRWLQPDGIDLRLPVPHFNVINGGVHAANSLDFQEFMIVPIGAPTFAEALRCGAEIYAALRQRLLQAGYSVGLGDEGGFAPEVNGPEGALELIVAAIIDAGYQPGVESVAIALDPATSEFHHDGIYAVGGEQFSSSEMIERYAEMVEEYPIWSIEDGLAESDWDGWAALTERLGKRIQLVGDDIFVTNPAIIASAIDRHIANAALIKLNQIGSVTETLDAIGLCRDSGYATMVSHRSGETSDPFIADLAVAIGSGQIKSGAPARGERVAKYNRLAAIEHAEAAVPYGLEP